jgi:hypothetical protein
MSRRPPDPVESNNRLFFGTVLILGCAAALAFNRGGGLSFKVCWIVLDIPSTSDGVGPSPFPMFACNPQAAERFSKEAAVHVKAPPAAPPASAPVVSSSLKARDPHSAQQHK